MMRASWPKKGDEDAEIVMNIAFEENIFKQFFTFRKKFKSLHCLILIVMHKKVTIYCAKLTFYV